jgi:hypothetical protein
MNILYDYLFHFNPYTKEWNAFKREDKEKYFNGEQTSNEILRAKTFNVLLGYLRTQKTQKTEK